MKYQKVFDDEVQRNHKGNAGDNIARAILIAGLTIAASIDELADSQESTARHLEEIKEQFLHECKKGGAFNH